MTVSMSSALGCSLGLSVEASVMVFLKLMNNSLCK